MTHCLRTLFAGCIRLERLTARRRFWSRIRGVFTINAGSGSDNEFLRPGPTAYLKHVQRSKHIAFHESPWVLNTISHTCTCGEVYHTVESFFLKLINNPFI